MREAVSPNLTVAVVAVVLVLAGAVGYFAAIRPAKQSAQPTQDEMRAHMQQASHYMQQSAQRERADRRSKAMARRQGSGAEHSADGQAPPTLSPTERGRALPSPARR